jgi:hypothetical protein
MKNALKEFTTYCTVKNVKLKGHESYSETLLYKVQFTIKKNMKKTAKYLLALYLH